MDETTGSCICGDIAWAIAGPFGTMMHCHCTMCRKSHGVAYTTFVTFAPEALRWVRGADKVRTYVSSPGSARNFCGRCGSKVPSLAPFAYAFPAAMQGDFGRVPSAHLNVATKAPWHTIDDALPQHATFEGDGEAFATPRHTEPAADEIRGGCLCGAVAFELHGPLDGGTIVSCHCSRCRRARAAAHGSNLFVDPAILHWLRGEDEVVTFKLPEAERFTQCFCRTCGSILPNPGARGGPRVAIPCGALDDDPGVRDGLHIHVASGIAWLPGTLGEPRYDVFPPTFPAVSRTRARASGEPTG